jgi:hypothetical protein
MSVASLTVDVRELKAKLETLENFLNEGDNLTLPYRQMSLIVEDINQAFDKYGRQLEAHQAQINRFNGEAVKARNQIVYMFLTILATLFGKVIIQNFIGQ